MGFFQCRNAQIRYSSKSFLEASWAFSNTNASTTDYGFGTVVDTSVSSIMAGFRALGRAYRTNVHEMPLRMHKSAINDPEPTLYNTCTTARSATTNACVADASESAKGFSTIVLGLLMVFLLIAKAIVEPCNNFAANSLLDAALSGNAYCLFVLRLVRVMSSPKAAAMVAPKETFAPLASPPLQPAQPPPLGGVADDAPAALNPDDDDQEDDQDEEDDEEEDDEGEDEDVDEEDEEEDSVGDEFGAAA